MEWKISNHHKSLIRNSTRTSRGSSAIGQVVDSESLAAAIRACRNGGEWQQAVALSRDVEDRGLDGTLTYSALMGAYALNAMWEEAFNLLDILQRSKAGPGQPIMQ